MKHSFTILIAALLHLSACNGSATTNSSESTGSSETIETPGVFYKRFEGTVAGQPVVLQWHQYNNYAYGVYYYKKQGRKIELYSWEDTIKNGTDFYLTERSVIESPSDKDPHWLISVKEDKITGNWMSSDNSKSLPIELKEVYSTGSYPLSLLYVSDSSRLLENKPEPRALATSLIIAPSASMQEGNRKYLEAIIKQAINCNSAQAQISECIINNNKLYFDSYKKEASEIDTSGLSDPESTLSYLNYSSDRNIRVNYNDNDLLVLEDLTSDYSGGAHGNYASSFLNIDFKAQKLLKLVDVINSSDTLKLIPLLQQQARSYLKMKPDEPLSGYLFENSVPLTDNFYVTNTGITFVYNPYEIAAYAAGQINIFVSFSSIKDILTPSFRQRVRI